MIDWLGVAASALWIGGCTIALTTLNIARWQAIAGGHSLRTELAGARRRVTLYLAALLVCAGWAITPNWSWEQVLLAALAMVFAQQAWHVARQAPGQFAEAPKYSLDRSSDITHE